MIEQLQRTAQWLEARKGRVTGSLAGAALGLCHWRKPHDVLRAMVREYHGYPSEFESNPAVDWGVHHEKVGLLAFTGETGLFVHECGFIPYADFSGASPDGLTDDDGILEIKVPYSLRKQNPAQFKALKDQPHYYAQVQIEMLAADKKHGYFYQYVPEQGDVFDPSYVPPQSKLEPVELDQEWLTENMPKLRAFHDLYLSELENPEHLEPLRVVIDDAKAQSIVNRLGELDDSLAKLEEERADLIQSLINMAGSKNALICGRKLTLVERKGNVDYAKLLKDVAPDINTEAYRKKSSTSWRFS